LFSILFIMSRIYGFFVVFRDFFVKKNAINH
jgi:hypothetical protein